MCVCVFERNESKQKCVEFRRLLFFFSLENLREETRAAGSALNDEGVIWGVKKKTLNDVGRESIIINIILYIIYVILIIPCFILANCIVKNFQFFPNLKNARRKMRASSTSLESKR